MKTRDYFYFLFLFVLAFVFSVVARAQNYTITENELQTLEKTLTSLELNNANLLEKAQKSESKAANLQSKAESLQSKLEAQIATTTKLERSLVQYEIEKQNLLNDCIKLERSIASEKLKNKNKTVVIIILSCLIIILLFLACLYLLRKKSLYFT